MSFQVHPYADSFPMLGKEELESMADSIKASGQLQPIIVRKSDNLLIDGRNRLAACEIAKVKPRIEFWDLDEESTLHHIASANVDRRHLTTSQRAAFAAEYAERLKAILEAQPKPEAPEPGKGKKGRKASAKGEAVKEAAKKFKVSEKTVKAAGKAKKAGKAEAVKAGAASVHKANKEAAEAEAAKKPFTVVVNGVEIKIPDKLRAAFQSGLDAKREFSTLKSQFNRLYDLFCAGPGGAVVRMDGTLVKDGPEGKPDAWESVSAKAEFSRIMNAVPHCPCPECKGSGCKHCDKRGWLTKSQLSAYKGDDAMAAVNAMIAELKI